MMRHAVPFLLILAASLSTALALDPRRESYNYEYTLYPPGGFSVKKSKAIPRPDPKNKTAHPIVGADGKFTDLGAWYFALGGDAKAFGQWWLGYWSDDKVWKPGKTPVFEGTMAGNQGHRIIAWTGQLAKMIDRDPEFDPAVKAMMMSEE